MIWVVEWACREHLSCQEDDFLTTGRRPSSLPGGLGTLESQGPEFSTCLAAVTGSGLGYFKNKLKDLESAVQQGTKGCGHVQEAYKVFF